MAAESTEKLRVASRDCTSTTRVVTLTVSETAPSSRVMTPTDRRSAAFSTTLDCSTVLNESIVTLRL